MPRRVPLCGLVVAVALALAPAAAVADTVDPAPTQVLTTTFAVNGVSRNPANGNVYVSGNDMVIRVYAGNATGSAAPLVSFPLGCTPWQMTFNPTASAMLVACSAQVLELVADTGAVLHVWTGPTEARGAVYDGGGQVFAADRTGNVVWRFDASTSGSGSMAILGSQPSSALNAPAGIALRGNTLYVANNGSETVTEYALTPGSSPASTPFRTLTLPADVDETQSLTLDDVGNLYVAAFTGGVLVYPIGADGTSPPTRRLTGPNTGPGTTDVDVLPDRSVLVSQLAGGGSRVALFPALVPLPPPPPPAAVAPGAVTGLKVAGKKTDRKRTVSWMAGSAGSSSVTSYVVVVTKRKQQLLKKTIATTSVKLTTKKLKKSGKLTVTVTAVSAVGAGPPASATFKVKLPKNKPHHRG